MSDLPDRAGDLLHAGGDQPGPRLASHGPLPTRLRHHHRHRARSRRRVHRSEVTTLADKLYYYEVPCCAAGAGQEASPGDLVLVGVFTTESSSPSCSCSALPQWPGRGAVSTSSTYSEASIQPQV